MGEKNKNKYTLIFKTVPVLKPPGFRKLSHFSEMQSDASMHREGLKG